MAGFFLLSGRSCSRRSSCLLQKPSDRHTRRHNSTCMHESAASPPFNTNWELKRGKLSHINSSGCSSRLLNLNTAQNYTLILLPLFNRIDFYSRHEGKFDKVGIKDKSICTKPLSVCWPLGPHTLWSSSRRQRVPTFILKASITVLLFMRHQRVPLPHQQGASLHMSQQEPPP